MEISDKAFRAANRRGREMLRTAPHAVAARYDKGRDRIVVDLSTGTEFAFRPRDAQGLETATAEGLGVIEISGSGFGLHFPRLDADLYAAGAAGRAVRVEGLGRAAHGAGGR